MPISNTLLKTLEITMDTIFKASGTDIRIHGRENVPHHPVLYVVNHFTRMETFLMPYIIRKSIGKYPISLAFKDFFTGRMGEFMERVGAVSTTDPNRDAILVGSLLTDRHPVIIFPEGQMIKDKKIVEKGKFMVYNTGIRRPPHTGAARLALISQLTREKIRRFREKGDMTRVRAYAAHYGFSESDLDQILSRETYIVPVNITYFPIRARDNAIQKLAERLAGELSDRFREELEVEGTMVTGGVDIDINFGPPLPAGRYLSSRKEFRRVLDDDALYMDPVELRDLRFLKKLTVGLMQDYMAGIYGMTTINHDHIFSYILSRYRKNRIDENDFKNRAFLAVNRLLTTGIRNYHTSLERKQFYLLTDDYHDKYQDFIETATSDGLITLRDGVITKNARRFTRLYDFHSVRQDNIVEVLKNEIEPLERFTREIDRIMRRPPFFIRRRIRKHFIRLDNQLFENDYRKHYIEGESKPPEIGRPFLLPRFFGRRGVILVHGYMAAPEEIRPLAEYLHGKGYVVYGARLRGHGTAPEDLATKKWKKWYDSVSRAYIIMKNSVPAFAVAGFSTGAGIALLQAANKPGRFRCVISINAPLRLQNISSRLSSAVVLWNKFLGKLRVSRGRMEYVTNEPENRHINYFRNPVSGVNELGKLMKEVEGSLEGITDPVLVIQGSDDPVVNPVSGLEIYERLGTKRKQIFRVFSNRHGILRGRESEQVFSRVRDFLKEMFGA